jgi:LuxR family glucitol operon transcriptional activator
MAKSKNRVKFEHQVEMTMAKRPKINRQAGNALRELSRKMGFRTDADLVKIAHLDRGTLSKLFSGETGKPEAQTALKIVKAFVERSAQLPHQVLDRVIEIYNSSQYQFSPEEIDLLSKSIGNLSTDGGIGAASNTSNFVEAEEASVLSYPSDFASPLILLPLGNSYGGRGTEYGNAYPVGSPKEYAQKTGNSSANTFQDSIGEVSETISPTLCTSQEPRVYQNLPARDHTAFFGREKEMTRLLELLSPDRSAPRISIEGVGGLGKTTLALEAAYGCLQARRDAKTTPSVPLFDAIIFTSAKQQNLTTIGLSPRPTPYCHRTLHDIFREIAYTLGCPDITRAAFTDRLDSIRKILARQQVLLIVDNLETIEDEEEIVSFLYVLPPTVKVVITTRKQVLSFPVGSVVRMCLESLPEEDGLCLIQHQAQTQEVQMSHEECQELYQGTYGVPAAIVYAIGQLAAGYSQKKALTQLIQVGGEVARFFFEGSVQPLRGQSAHQLLMALAMFPKPATREAIASVADDTAEDLAQLVQLSLVKQYRQQCYGMLPLTRGYALAELSAQIDFERQARDRWVNWYLRFSEKYGGQDWQEWNEYKPLEQEWENLQEAIEWCIVQDRYEDFRVFWRYLKGWTHFCGYWDERLRWMDWSIEIATQHEDWVWAGEAMFDKARTLTLMNQPMQREEAIALCKQAWNLRDSMEFSLQFNLAIHLAVLYIHQEQFQQASHWLRQGQNLLQQARSQEYTPSREWIHILYYQAKICLQTEDYEQANTLYTEARKQAEVIGWKRGFTYIDNWLASVAIAQGNLDEADRLLKVGLPIAESNNDRRCIAFCKRSFALLEKARGNLGESRRWAHSAKEDFQRLKMIQEAEEMGSLLQI